MPAPAAGWRGIVHRIPAATRFEAVEAWVRAHVEWFVWVIVIAGYWVRFQLAGESYMNSDETQIMRPPLQHGLRMVYQLGLVFPYGPLMNFLLHFMTFFGNSERYFRMVAVVPGALLAYAAYRWVSYLYGAAAGVAAACILGFSPNLLDLSAEVRHYMMHAFLVACSLYCLERAFREDSLKWMRLFGASLLLALLTMYMSVWYTAGIGIYALVRIIAKRDLLRRLVVEWAAIQAAAGAICGVAYVTHLYRLRGSDSERFARDVWLRGSYFHSESQDLSDFLRQSTDALFAYVFANPAVGIWMVYAFFLGIALILWGGAGMPRRRRLSVLSLLLPIAATVAAAVAGLYPYGGSRHDAFLAIFIAAAVSVAISFAALRKVVIVLAAAAILLPQWQAVAQQHYLMVPAQFRRMDQMRAALDYLSKITPRPGVLVTDESSAELLDYYVCHSHAGESRLLRSDIAVYSCGGYQLMVYQDWSVNSDTLVRILSEARAKAPDQVPDPAWLFVLTDSGQTFTNNAEAAKGQFGRIHLGRVSP